MSDSSNQVILTFLDRMIDESVKTTEALSTLRLHITEQRNQINDLGEKIAKDFRIEIKDHISEENDKTQDILQQSKESLDKNSELLRVFSADFHKISELDRALIISLKEYIQESRSVLQTISLRIDSEDEKSQRIESFKKLDEFIDWIKNPKTYLSIIGGIVVSIATIVGGAIIIVDKIGTYLKPDAKQVDADKTPRTDK